jgi:hypothetical protein
MNTPATSTLLRLLVATCVATMLAACAGNRVGERQQARLELAESLAGESVDSVWYQRLQNWEPLSEDRLIIWTRTNEAWLLDVQRPCSELPWAQGISIPTMSRQIRANFDSVQVRHQRCRITRIRELDARALREGGDMRRIEQAQDEAGGT